jgi:hypothetical protein
MAVRKVEPLAALDMGVHLSDQTPPNQDSSTKWGAAPMLGKGCSAGIRTLSQAVIVYALTRFSGLKLIMPGWRQTTSHLNPLAYVVDSLRTFMLAGSASAFGPRRIMLSFS